MPTISKIIQKPISDEWGAEGDSISVIRTENFSNEGKIDFANVATDGIFPKNLNLPITKPKQ
jgi:type I restriction enzyme, S subunit